MSAPSKDISRFSVATSSLFVRAPLRWGIWVMLLITGGCRERPVHQGPPLEGVASGIQTREEVVRAAGAEADTFTLASIGGRLLPTASTERTACASDTVTAGWYVLRSDSTYEYLEVTRRGCMEPVRNDSTWVNSRYTQEGKRVQLYVGDGDEEFQAGAATRWPDSLVQHASAAEYVRRYVLRGSTKGR